MVPQRTVFSCPPQRFFTLLPFSGPMVPAQPYTVSRTEAQAHIKLANRLVRLGEKMGLSVLELDRDAILSRARKKTGLDDLGNEKYVEVIDRLLDNAGRVDITPLGKCVINFLVYRTAVNRLHIEDYLGKHPEVEELAIRSPLFVMGLPRTGTTLLQNVLSVGAGYRALRLWELATPYPLSEDPERDRKLRRRKVDLPLRLARIAVPEMNAGHHVKLDSKEECWMLIANTMVLTNTDMATGLHDWNNFLLSMDRGWVFREYRRLLQIQAHSAPSERFVLKCPTHLWNIEHIIKEFPDACIVWTHRDPVMSISSFSSLMGLARRVFFGTIDMELMGSMMEDRFHASVLKAQRCRDRIGEERRGEERFYDVNFDELVKDIPGAVERIKENFGLPYDIKEKEAVKRYLERPREDKPGSHVYGPEQFGLDPEEIAKRFGDYIGRYGIRVMGK